VKEMGKNEPGREGSKKKRELKKRQGDQRREEEKEKPNPTQVDQGLQLGLNINGWPQNWKIGWCVGGCWITPALLQALFTFLHSEATLYFFLSFSKTFLDSHFIPTTY